MTQYIGGLNFADTGQMQALDATAGVPAGATFIGGWATQGSTGKPYVQDLIASAVPAGAVMIGGAAFHQDGRRYVTTQAPAASDIGIGGFGVRADGALRVSTAAVGATDQFINGWAVAQTTAARMAIA